MQEKAKPSQPAWFVTGTDTGIGKTFIACALLHALHARHGFRAAGMKPVAAGLDAAGKNDDVEQLMAASSIKAPSSLVNPYALRAAVAPQIAAEAEGRNIELAPIVAAFQALRALADAVVVEGVGGFCVPLSAQCDTADLAVALDLPVILVVGIKLGCINHALLSQQAILARGLKLAGWVANCIEPATLRPEENRRVLEQRIAAPLLGIIPYGATPQQAAQALKLPEIAVFLESIEPQQ
jgi:dethiobiotin synthetase